MTRKQSESAIPSTLAQVEAGDFDKTLTYQDKEPHEAKHKRRRPMVLQESPEQAKRKAPQKKSIKQTSLRVVVNTSAGPVLVVRSAKGRDIALITELLPSDEQKELAKVEANIADIQTCFDIGKQLVKECPRHAQDGLIEKRAEELGIPAPAARRYRKMALLYEQSELDSLFAMFRGNRFALAMTHFVHLITVEKSDDRDSITVEAVTNKMSVKQLYNLKIERFGNKRSYGGRIPDSIKGEGTQALIDAVKSELASWIRWLNLLLAKHKGVESPLQNPLNELLLQTTKVHKLSQMPVGAAETATHGPCKTIG